MQKMTMEMIRATKPASSRCRLLSLGQAGYLIQTAELLIAVDPYLSDYVGKQAPAFSRILPIPIEPEALHVDMLVLTHDHGDHLDPETINAYSFKKQTTFVAPRLACAKLRELGIPKEQIHRVDTGEHQSFRGVDITGVYTIPNEPSVVDTAGYFFQLANGRSLYHTSDTGFSSLLLQCAPHAEVLLVCINGKWGNLNVHEAVQLATHVKPHTVIPNHWDMMELNSENPHTFKYFMENQQQGIHIEILNLMDEYTW